MTQNNTGATLANTKPINDLVSKSALHSHTCHCRPSALVSVPRSPISPDTLLISSYICSNVPSDLEFCFVHYSKPERYINPGIEINWERDRPIPENPSHVGTETLELKTWTFSERFSAEGRFYLAQAPRDGEETMHSTVGH